MEIKVIRFYPEDWDTYRDGLMELENVFEDPELIMTEDEKFECMTDPDAYCYIALDGGRVIGETYGNVLQKVDLDWFDGHWEPKSYRNYNCPTLYITSTATLPEYRGMGVAKQMKYKMFTDLRDNGFDYAIGHSNQGTMTKINQWFNGEVIQTFEHWYGSEETHELMEVDLNKIPKLLPVKHLEQLKDYDCGIASADVLFNNDFVHNLGDAEVSYFLTPELGISHEDLLYYCHKVYGFTLSTSYSTPIDKLTEQIEKWDKLVIVNYQTEYKGEKVGHYSVVFGYDERNIYIMDVTDGKEKKIPIPEFEKNWYSNLYGYKWMAHR